MINLKFETKKNNFFQVSKIFETNQFVKQSLSRDNKLTCHKNVRESFGEGAQVLIRK